MLSTETPNSPGEHLLLYHGSSDETGIVMSQLPGDDQEVEKRDGGGRVKEPPLRRYSVRPLVTIFIPALITTYYGVIWVYLIQGIAHDEAAKYRTFSGSLIFHSLSPALSSRLVTGILVHQKLPSSKDEIAQPLTREMNGISTLRKKRG